MCPRLAWMRCRASPRAACRLGFAGCPTRPRSQWPPALPRPPGPSPASAPRGRWLRRKVPWLVRRLACSMTSAGASMAKSAR
eukprot:6714846-Alexandrium_andersonii.AAC.1